jgi:Alcohol dehydrogenase GroES-like domain
MKAIALGKYGTGKDLDLIDREVPVAKAQEVLIRVHAAAVNLIDLKKAAGAFKDFMPLSFPWIPGVDFSGIVESVGQGITDYQAGDEVYGAKMEGGTYAEYLTIDAAFIALKPRRLRFAEAASVPVAAETAWQVLRHANILLDFLVSEGKENLTMAEWNAYRYELFKDSAGHRGVMIFGVVRRETEDITSFLNNLGELRKQQIKTLTSYSLPGINLSITN